MAFGYTPSTHRLKDFIKRLIGWPNISRRVEASLVFKLLNPKPKERIIDLGCGKGIFCIELARRESVAIGIDISPTTLVHAKCIAQKMGLGNVVFVATDAQKLPFRNKSFNKALCNCTLEHITDDKAVVAGTWRVLKKNGAFVLTVPNARKNVGQSVLPLTKFVISSQWLKRQIARQRRSIQESSTIEEMQRKLLFEEFNHVRTGYTISNLKAMLGMYNFQVLDIKCYLQTFGAIAQDVRYTLRGFEHRMLRYILFPFIYVIALLDKLIPENIEGYGIALKAIKT